jgi:uncharacterized cupin superfamily protein
MSVNLFGDEWDGGRDRPGWEWKRLQVGERLGAEKIGASLYELAPGQRTFPYHWQAVQEEWLIVFGIFGEDLRKILRADAEIDYFDGEE